MNCETAREAIHDLLDGDRGAAPDPELAAHLASCPACRETLDDLAALQDSLRDLPREPLPPATLDVVWKTTVRARGTTRPRILGSWRAAAAAVFVTALGASTLYLVSLPSVPPGPSAAELAHAEAQAELVFGYTARALAATREATARQVIESKVSPAVRGAAAPRPPRRSS